MADDPTCRYCNHCQCECAECLTPAMADDTVEAAKRRLIDTIHDVEAMPTDDEAWDDPIDLLIAAVRAEGKEPK